MSPRTHHRRVSTPLLAALLAATLVVGMAAVASGVVGRASTAAKGTGVPAECATQNAALTSASVAATRASKQVKQRAAKVKAAAKRVRQARQKLRAATNAGSASDVQHARRALAASKKKLRTAKVRLRTAQNRLQRARADVSRTRAALQDCLFRVAEQNTPPRLVSAELTGAGQVLLKFNRPMGESAEDVASYSSSPGLFISSATRLDGLDQVLLQTGTLYAVPYRITVSGDVFDAGGQPIDPEHRTAEVTGTVAVKDTRPAVTSAGSTGNTTVVVQFSKPMGDSALAPTAYQILREPSIGAGGVPVTAARFTDSGRLSVELTTGAQSEVDYRVRVSDVVDIIGLPLADRTGGVGSPTDPTSAVFRGTPEPAGALVDSDCDGLTDAEELRGYQVRVDLANGESQVRAVTSDPGSPDIDCADPAEEDDADGDGTPDSADTDADALDDAVEKSLGTDPRDADSDDDGLTDDVEYNETYSEPTGQDTDDDGLTDGLETGFFTTSAILADTDGDQIDDGTETTLATRNPRIADLPQPALEIGEMNLDLDVRFVDRVGTERREVDTEQVSTTLTQTASKEFATTDARTLEAGTKLSQTAGFKVGYDEGPTAEASFSTTTEQSFNSTFLSQFTDTSKTETQKARQESLTSEVAQAESADRTREVSGAAARVAVTLKSAGDIAFTIRHLQVVALIQDPQDPSRLKPLATLLPTQEPETGYNLGPLVPERGPIVFENTQVFPQMVDDLMRNPRGLVFKFSNYDILDELGRNFAYTSQEINDRTAGLVIDYGGVDGDGDGFGDLTEKERIATGTGRLVDTNEDGVLGEGDRRAVFDADGKNLGITLRDAMAAAGLTEYREDEDPTASLTQEQVDHSYSVVERASGGERIYRIRRTGMEPGIAKQWEVVTPTGIDQALTLDTVIMDAGQTYTLAFLADTDEDRLPALLESINGCMDSPEDGDGDGHADSADSDGDGLDDRFELLVGWKVDTEQGSRQVRSRCASADTDGDGLTDDAEAPGVVERDADGLIDFGTGHAPRRDTSGTEDLLLGWSLTDPITDPTSADTDLDGLLDDFELTPYRVKLLSPPAPPDSYTPYLVTSPEHFDSDRDTASDGVEYRVGGNPRSADFGNFGDNDSDGVVNVLEGVPYNIGMRGVSTGGTCDSVCPNAPLTSKAVTSDPDVADTDGDGLDDGEERRRGTNPEADGGRDTDGDGLTDFEEVRGYTVRDLGVITSSPRDADSDNDKRSDGAEAGRTGPRLIVRVPGEAPYEAFSSPVDADEDLDRLVDGDEVQAGTDPGLHNTDGDNRSDYNEVLMAGRRPLVPDLRVRVNFAGLEVDKDADDGSSAGDFWFAVGVRKPNGELWCEGEAGCGTPEQMPLTSWTGGPYEIDIRDCNGDDELDGACRWSDERINIQSGYGLPSMDKEVMVGSVGTSDAELESFSLSGFLEEREGSGVDCHADFPNPQNGDQSGTILGTDLKPGITVINVTREMRCRTGEGLKFTVLATYTAD